MSDPFGQSDDHSRYDIEFAVPLVHRLRFTRDCFGGDFEVIRDLLEPSVTEPARIQVWIDEGLAAWDESLCQRITHRSLDR